MHRLLITINLFAMSASEKLVKRFSGAFRETISHLVLNPLQVFVLMQDTFVFCRRISVKVLLSLFLSRRFYVKCFARLTE